MRQRRVIVVLPAYNEEAGLGKLLRRMEGALEGRDAHVVVVDDGSTDRTAEVACTAAPSLSVEVVPHGVNQGLGAAIRTGFGRGLELAADDDDLLVTLDSDDTHNPYLIRRMIALVEEGNDVVIASRYQPGAAIRGVSAWRRLTSWTAGWLFRVAFPFGVRDFTCGFRVYRAGVLRVAQARYGERLFAEEGFACMADILVKLGLMGAICAEVPLILRYDQKDGPSKMRVGRTIARTLRLILERRLGRY